MSTYVIGDLQGCYGALMRLLESFGFDQARDRLWFAGDLVNRGADSAGVLRFVMGLGERAVSVLGNHDLHLLMVSEGYAKLHRRDTVQDVLEAPDRDELLDWLRWQPLIHRDGRHVMVHAGLLPSWSVDRAVELAREVEEVLRGPRFHDFCQAMYGNLPASWDDELEGFDRLRVIVNALTRLRICTPQGAMELKFTGPPGEAPPGYVPWFDAPGRLSADHVVACGHWSALGLVNTENLIATDTGCLWGGRLTAVRLEDRQVFQVPCGAAGD